MVEEGEVPEDEEEFIRVWEKRSQGLEDDARWKVLTDMIAIRRRRLLATVCSSFPSPPLFSLAPCLASGPLDVEVILGRKGGGDNREQRL